MTRYQRERARAESIVRAVIDDLSGRADHHADILDVEPQSRLCIGVLTPPPALGEPDAGPRRTKRKPDSLGFDARVEPFEGKVSGTIDVSFFVYYRVIPTLEEQRLNVTGHGKQSVRPKYRRSKIAISNLPFSVDLPSAGGMNIAVVDAANEGIVRACLTAATAMRDDPDYWPSDKDIKVESSDLANETAYRTALLGFVPETAKWLGRIEVACASAGDGYRLTVLFSNVSPASEAHPSRLFDVQLGATLSSGKFASKCFAAAALDYRYSTTTYGHGVNAVLEVDVEERSAIANATPIYLQQRLTSRDIGESSSPTALDGDGVFDALAVIEAELRSYEERWSKFIDDHPDAKVRAESMRDLDEFRSEIETFRLGLAALREDERLLKAFRLMNETVGSRHVRQWHLFQIVFIVSMLPSLLAREQPTDPRWRGQLEIADILWFPTGGGKTEAYFGIIVTAMFYDRLRGKKRGTTAWLRYPLRMLSIQQLQRLVEFAASAETVRIKHGVDGGDPFTVGYYVGSANTPNYLSMKNGPHPIVTLKAKMMAGGPNAGSLRVLQRCPFCRSINIEIHIEDDIQKLRIHHRCVDCGRQAPISISDAEIYRYLPTVLVGTVDRLARAGETSHFAHIFGQVDSKCPQHEYASFRECVESGCKLTKSKFLPVEPIKDPTPALLLQDELHLLKESLGTYNSHYEGYLDEQARGVGTGLPPKRLAATATIEGYERHVNELYARRARRFPSKGIDLDDTPYACEDSENPHARLYCGILPFGLTTDQVCARIAEAVHKAAEGAWNTPDDQENGFYDLSLLYANLKDGVGNMGSSLHDALGANFVKTLSGEHSLDQVREVIDVVEGDVGRPYSERLKCVVATSIISHGVDLERLNVMAFSGFPGRAADYIQASSRVGRKHVGVVFAVYNPIYNIDRSAYLHFREYHERLYQLVQPVPINKFSEAALVRTFNGIYAATLLNVLSREKHSNFVRGNTVVSALIDGTVSDAEMRERVSRSYGIQGLPDADLRAKYEALIAKKTTDAHMDIEMGEEWATYRRLKPVPVSSLRKVQEQIGFRIDARRIRTVEALRRNVQ